MQLLLGSMNIWQTDQQGMMWKLEAERLRNADEGGLNDSEASKTPRRDLG
jgi:hypothetical protein